MTGEPPVAGTVVRCRDLRRREVGAGDHTGRKDRPAAIILARSTGGETIVVPFTHTEPADAARAVEIPAEERRRVGLDAERSWIVATEFNAFRWPGSDLRPVPGREPETAVYDRLSGAFLARVGR